MSAPHIERMKEEFSQLDERFSKLSDFIRSNPIFKTLPFEERDLMKGQRDIMDAYRDILKTRILLAERSQ